MNERKTPLWIQIIALTAALGFTAAQLWLIYTYYEPQSCFYKYGSLPPTVFGVALAAAAVLLFASYFVYGKDERGSREGENVLSRGAGLLAGFLFAAGSLFCAWIFLRDGSLVSGGYPAAGPLSLLTVLFGAFAAVYFIMNSLGLFKKPRTSAALGMFVVLWGAAYLMFIYFRMAEPLNSPLRVLRLISLLAVMFHWLYVIRVPLGIPLPRLYRVSASIAVLFVFVSVIPEIVFTAAGVIPFDNFILFRGAQLCAAVSVAAKLFR